MRFNNGMFGACICVLALLGTAIGGFVLNVHEDQREVTKYNFIADVSGLFSYSDAPEYISYNPSSNYVGYTPGAVEYTQSSTANNYRYVAQTGATSTQTLVVDDDSVYPSDYGNAKFSKGTDRDGNTIFASVRALWNGSSAVSWGTPRYASDTGYYFNMLPEGYGSGDSYSAHFTKLSNIVQAIPDIDTYQTVEIIPSYTTSDPVLFYAGSWDVHEIPWNGGTRYDYYTTFNENNSMPDRIVVDSITTLATAYRGGDMIWSVIADEVGVCAWYSTLSNGNSPTPVATSVTLDVTGTGFSSYAYMMPSAGVKTTTTDATWSNGYENSVIDLKVTKNGDNASAPGQFVEFRFQDVGVNCYLFGNTLLVQYGLMTDLDHWTNLELGTWLGVQLRVDALSGNITVTPTNDVDLTKTVEPTAYSTVIEGLLTPGTLSTFKVEGGSSNIPSMKFQVTDTKVFLNTYNTVMIDPSIEITDYFPNYSDYRLNFYSFALLGSSMSINGQNCPINKDNGTITFTNVAGFEFTKKLENLYITFNDDRTYLTFVNDNSTYDLGETTSTVISFVGWWYFTTGLYEITEGMETFWNWDLNGFQATGGECLLIFLTIIGAGIIVYSVYGKGKIQLFDWLVIIFAVFIGSALLGF